MTKQLKEIGKAVLEGLTVFVGFGMLSVWSKVKGLVIMGLTEVS